MTLCRLPRRLLSGRDRSRRTPDLPAQALPFCDRRSQLEVARHAISALLHVRAAGPVAWRSRADLVFLRYRVQGDLLPPTHAHGKLVAAGQSLKPGTIRAGSRVSLTFRQAQMPKHRVRRGPCSEPGAEVRAWHGREHLLLVVDRPAAVGDHIGWVVRGDEQRVDVAAGDRQAEVVADESPRTVGVGAHTLAQAADRLARLLGIPAEIGDPRVAADRHRAASG